MLNRLISQVSPTQTLGIPVLKVVTETTEEVFSLQWRDSKTKE